MPKMSLSTWIFDRLPFEEVAKRVKRCGYNAIELSGYNWVHDVWTVEEVAKVCERKKIEVLSVHCNHHALYTADDWSLDRYEAYHDTLYRSLRIFGKPIIVEHGLAAQSIYAGDTAKHIELLKKLSAHYGIALSFENVPATVFQQPDEMDGLFDEALWFTFDVAHAAYLGIDPLAFERHFTHMINAHMYDVVPGVGLSDWAPVGTGMIDWPRYMMALKNSGYAGPITVELTEEHLSDVLRIYNKVTRHDVAVDVTEQFAVHAREQLERYL